ncbi:MAG: QueT transporter family protein [Candidatus Odinarchaeia archaeon]
MLNRTVFVSLSGIFIALYACGVIIFAPISFGIVQVRVIDCLIPLSAVFGLPVVIGVSVGNIAANIYGGLGLIDIVGGTVANLIASIIVLYIKNLKPASNNSKQAVLITVIASFIASLIITVIVGGYLSIIFNVPVEISLLGVFIGSIISITLLGSLIVTILENTNIRDMIKLENK